MQARLSFQRLPSTFVAFALVLVVALLAGGLAGYALKTAAVSSTPARIVVVPGSGGAAYDTPCTWVNHEKQC